MNIELKTAAAYIRVSTDKQTELSPDSQIKEIQTYAKQHGYIVPKEYIFRDDGISGKSAKKRPSFNMMIATAKQKPSPFSAILLWKFSRFARNQEESIFYKSVLRKNGVDVISISEPLIEGPFGKLIERIMEWYDEYYLINLSSEVKSKMIEKVERGGAVSIPAFGYDIVNKEYIPNTEQVPIVQRIYSDFLAGKPYIQIAKELNALGIRTNRGGLWENRTIEYILRNPVYIGKIRWNPERRTRRNYDDPDIMIVDGHHEPIIDAGIFEETQNKIADIKKKYHKYSRSHVQNDYMLRGLVKCSNCGSSLTMAVKGTSLQCVKYIHGKCAVSHSISIPKINAAVIDGIDKALSSGVFELNIKPTKETAPALDISAMIRKDKEKLRRVKEAYEDGVYTLEEFKEARTQINEHIEYLQQAHTNALLDENAIREKFVADNINVTQRLRDPLTDESYKNELLKSFVDKIIFNRKSGEIRIFFYYQ